MFPVFVLRISVVVRELRLVRLACHHPTRCAESMTFSPGSLYLKLIAHSISKPLIVTALSLSNVLQICTMLKEDKILFRVGNYIKLMIAVIDYVFFYIKCDLRNTVRIKVMNLSV